jgi:hypothetical protein
MTPTQTRSPALPRAAPRPVEDVEPTAGLWSYRLARVLALALLILVVPAALAVGLRWLSWERAQALAPLLGQLAITFWVLSLFGVVLGVIGLSQFGGKARTLRGLALHLLFSVGPIVAAIVLRL